MQLARRYALKARPLRSGEPVTTLSENLGFDPDAKLLIINCDDLGSCWSANVGIYESLRTGLATTASLMVPGPWARSATANYRGDDIGVHLTLNSEFEEYRWGPITQAPSLLDGNGGFPRTVEDTWDHADLDEVRRELQAQIERAILWGIDVTHLDSHMGTLQLRADFFGVYLELATDFNLPLRMGPVEGESLVGFPYRELARQEGVLFPDHFIYYQGVGSRPYVEEALANLKPGVTEIYLHPAIDSDELRAAHPDWVGRVDDYKMLNHDLRFRNLVEKAGVTLIGYRELRDQQKAG